VRNDSSDSAHALLEANWRRKMIDPIGQVWTPFGYARGDVYRYSDTRDPDTLERVPNDTAARGVAAGGLVYAYPFVAHTAFASHVIEPTAQIIARQNRADQRRLPDEDAKSLVFDDTLLFDVDKFSGYDRFETGTRANVGVQYTLQANNGIHARFVFGRSYHLAGENPYTDPGFDPTARFNFSPLSGLDTNRSDYVTGLYLTPFAGFSVITQSRFGEDDWALRRNDTIVQGAYGPLFGSAAYSYTHFDPGLGLFEDQQNISASLGVKLTNHWAVSGTTNYDITDKRRIQDLFQIKYSDECFVLTATYIETFVENAALNLKPDRTLMLRFELKYIGEFNYRTDQLNHIFGDQNTGPKL
jgi:LPS-assembly protein